MSVKNLFKRLLPFLWIELFFLLPLAVVQARADEQFAWRSLETKHCIIRYQSLEDLEQFDDQIDYSLEEGGLRWLFSDSESTDLAGKLARKVDALFERVQEILDMRKKMKKVKINI